MVLLLTAAATSFWGSTTALILAIVCLAVGLVLCVIEMFIPGFGVAGASGTVLLFLGVILKSVGSEGGLTEAVILVLGVLVILGIMAFFSVRSLNKGALSRSPIVLDAATTAEEGFSSVSDLSAYMGREGVAATILRPAGTAEIDGKRLDVVTEGEFIQPGTPVRVVEVTGYRVVVQAADA